jgi:hypothetical protein
MDVKYLNYHAHLNNPLFIFLFIFIVSYLYYVQHKYTKRSYSEFPCGCAMDGVK